MLAACSGEEKAAETEIPVYKTGLEFSLMQINRRSGISGWREYVLLCRSTSTLSARAQPKDFVPKGSVLVGRIGFTELDTTSGRDEFGQAANAAGKSLEFGDGWIAWKHRTFRISLDRCATWLDFVPWKVIPPSEVILSNRPCGDEECAKLGFARQTIFRDFRVERRAKSPGSERIGFTLRSDVLANSNVRQVTSEDGGRTWHVSTPAEPNQTQAGAPQSDANRDSSFMPAQAGAWQPDVSRYVAPTPAKPASAAPVHALTDEDLARIPTPGLREPGSFAPYLIEKIKKAAKAGSVSGVKEVSVDGIGSALGSDEVDRFKEAVLRAMAEKAAKAELSAKQSRSTGRE